MRQIVLRISRAFQFDVRPPHVNTAAQIPPEMCCYMTVLHPQLGDPDFDGYLMKQGEVPCSCHLVSLLPDP